MTTFPEYVITLTADLKVGQQFRHGPPHPWITATQDHIAGEAVWVEAKPIEQPPKVGDRVGYRCGGPTATVKYAGERWLIVQVDAPHGSYEDAWAVRSVEHPDR